MRNDPYAYPPRGMSREEAARYIGVSPTKFDELVADKRMPGPRRMDGRVVWDRFGLDLSFNELPERDGGFQALLEASRKTPAQMALEASRLRDPQPDQSAKAVAARIEKAKKETLPNGRKYWRDAD